MWGGPPEPRTTPPVILRFEYFGEGRTRGPAAADEGVRPTAEYAVNFRGIILVRVGARQLLERCFGPRGDQVPYFFGRVSFFLLEGSS
jgi:hypothetical protein